MKCCGDLPHSFCLKKNSAVCQYVLPLLQNKDIVTHSRNTSINVLQRNFVGTQNHVLQTVVVTHSVCFIKMCY